MVRINARIKGLGKMEIGKAIRDARKAKGLTLEALAGLVGTDSGNLSRLERGKQGASQELLIKILDALDLPLGPTLAARSMQSNIDVAYVQAGAVPVISWVQAGHWTEVMSSFTAADAVDWVVCPIPHGPRTFVLKVRGESMFNPHARRSFREGDLIYVDPDRQAGNGSLVVALLADSLEATFKQLVIEGAEMFLKALNPSWPDRFIRVDEGCQITGVVIFKGEYM